MLKRLRILFILDHISFHEVSSIPILCAIAKKEGHQVKLVEFARDEKRALREIVSFAPDIIAYSACSNEASRYLEINRVLKSQMKTFSVFGGPHPTFFPSFIEEQDVDAICVGEGDICFAEFLRHFGTDKMYEVNNFGFKMGGGDYKKNSLTDLVTDLDVLPFPDRDIIYSKSYFNSQSPIKTFAAGRGCPYKCSYCFNHAYNSMYRGKGKILRTKSVSYLIREINSVSNRYPLGFVKFQDDIFGANSHWLDEFADRFPREVGLPFLCYARPNMITEKFCVNLKKAGCHSVSIGIECGNEELRGLVLDRKLTDKQILSSCEILKKVGLRIYTLNMIGLPGETESDIFKTIELNQKCQVDFADASIFQPYPGTRLTEYCIQKGYIEEGIDNFEGAYLTSVMNFSQDFKNKLYVIHKLFLILVDFPNLVKKVELLYRTRRLNYILNIIYRVYFGYSLHHRIYARVIKLSLYLRGAILVLISKYRA